MEEDLRALEAIREAEAALQERFAQAESEAARILADARKEAARLTDEAERSTGDQLSPTADVPTAPDEDGALPSALFPLIERLADQMFETLRKEEE